MNITGQLCHFEIPLCGGHRLTRHFDETGVSRWSERNSQLTRLGVREIERISSTPSDREDLPTPPMADEGD